MGSTPKLATNEARHGNQARRETIIDWPRARVVELSLAGPGSQPTSFIGCQRAPVSSLAQL